MSGSKTISTSDTRIEALQLQSSAYGVTIPIVGGVTRIAGNLIYYNDFKSIPTTTTQGGKGGGSAKTQNTTFTYQASLIMALCYGQIAGVPRIWKGKKLFSDLLATPATILQAIETYAVPAGVNSNFVVAHASYFGSNVSVTFTSTGGLDGTKTLSMSEGIDYVQSNGSYSFFAACIAGGFTVNINYSYTSTVATNPALTQLGCTLMPGYPTQPAPSWVTSLHPGDALPYSAMAAVSAQGYDLGGTAQVDNHTFEVVGPGAYSISSAIPDTDPAAFVINVLKDARYGARIPAKYIGAATAWTPISTPMMVRTISIHRASFKLHAKLLPQGAFSRNTKTITPTTPTDSAANNGVLTRATEIAIAVHQIHHVSG